MAFYKNHVGIHISKSKLQLVEIDYSENNFLLENVDEEYFSNFISFDDRETKVISILQSAFDEIILRQPLKSNLVSFALPNSMFRVFQVPFDDSLIKEDLEEHFKWEFSILYPADDVDEYYIQNIKLKPGNYHKSNSAIIFAIKKIYIKILSKFCQRNNLILKLVDNEHIAANTSIYVDSSGEKNKLFSSLVLNENYFSIMLTDNFIPIYFKNKNYSSQNELPHLIKSEFDLMNKLTVDAADINKPYLLGNIYSAGILEQIRDATKLELEEAYPFLGLRLEKSMEGREFVNNKFNSFCSAAGIAYRLI